MNSIKHIKVFEIREWSSFERMLCLYVILLIIFLTVFLTGCSSYSTSPSTAPANVRGRIIGSGNMSKLSKANAIEAGVQGATVILAEVKTDGSLETVSNAAVQTDVSGNFTIQTNLNGVSNLMVIATKDSNQWKGVIASQIQSGSTVYIQPLDDETTAQADVFIRAKTDNYNNVTYITIKNYINSRIASQIKGDVNLTRQVAAALNTEAQAESQSAASSTFSISQSQWQTIVNSQYNAEAELETSLYNSFSTSSEDNAYETYYQSLASSYVKAGLSLDTYGKVLEISNYALVNSTANINSQLSSDFEQSAALLRSKVIGYAVNDKFKVLGATNEQIKEVNDASAALSFSIENGFSNNDLGNAFAAFRSRVISDLKLIFSADAVTISAIDSSVASYKAELTSSINANTTTNDLIPAYSKFYSNVNNTVALTMNKAGSDKIKAISDTFILLYAGN